MRKPILTFLHFLKKALLSLLGLVAIYFVAVLLFGLWSVNRSFGQSPEGIEIIVMDNGVHTDLALPVNSNVINWNKHLQLKDYKGANAYFTHFAFGWGNRKFYMETPEWRDLELDVALSAVFGFGQSAMHVYYLPDTPKPSMKNIKLRLSEEEYQKLVTYILDSFQKQENGQFKLIKGKGYTTTDNFYEANGSFSAIKTCNTWTNSGLKAAGIKTVLWAPVPHFMMRKLRKLNQTATK